MDKFYNGKFWDFNASINEFLLHFLENRLWVKNSWERHLVFPAPLSTPRKAKFSVDRVFSSSCSVSYCSLLIDTCLEQGSLIWSSTLPEFRLCPLSIRVAHYPGVWSTEQWKMPALRLTHPDHSLRRLALNCLLYHQPGDAFQSCCFFSFFHDMLYLTFLVILY